MNPGGRRTASAYTGGPVVNSDERGKPVDGLEPVVLLGWELCENETDPVMPVSQYVILKEHNGLVDRSGPGATQSMTEPSALLTLKTDWMENAAVGPVGPDGNLTGRDEAGDRSDPAASRSGTDWPVWTDEGGDVPNYSVGLEVLLAGQMEIVARPDPVGPHSRPEQSVSLRLDADQGEHIPTPPTAGGLVGRFPDPGPLKYSKISSPDDSYQPLFTGPLGTNEMNAINDLSRPTASGPLGRQCSLDPMGPRAMLSLGDGNQPPSVGPVGRPWIPEQPGDQVTESDCKRTTQTRSESESDTGRTLVWPTDRRTRMGFPLRVIQMCVIWEND